MNNKILVVLGALVLALSIPLYSVYAKTQPFPDVPATKHFAEAVNELAERNIIGGYPDGTFKPGNSITRGQAAAIIAKMTKLDTTNVKDPKFKDVTLANGYYKAIAALAEKGVIKGYADGRFGPNDSITRAQMASILIKAFELPLYRDPDYGFKDVVHKNSHRDSIYSMYRLDLTTGTTPTTFSPNAPITRGQAAKLLKAAEDIKPGILTLYAKDYNWKRFNDVSKTNSDVFDIVPANETPMFLEPKTKIHIVPKKEGKSTLNFTNHYSATVELDYKKYYVHVEKNDGEWNISLEETEDIYSTPLELWSQELRTGNEALIETKSVTLSTEQGEVVEDHVQFRRCADNELQYCTGIHVDKPGKYIATVHYTDKKVIRYSVVVTQYDREFYYSARMMPIRSSEVVQVRGDAQLGKHVLPKGSEKIATVTRNPGTNVFHITAKKAGEFFIDFPDSVVAPGSHTIYYGITVRVSEVGPYLNVYAELSFEDDMIFD